MSDIARDIEMFLAEGYAEVEADMESVGESAVAYNVANGDYKNRTGNLRRSNYYKIDKDGDIPTRLEIGNSADYAEDVESRGYMVASGGFLLAESILKK